MVESGDETKIPLETTRLQIHANSIWLSVFVLDNILGWEACYSMNR